MIAGRVEARLTCPGASVSASNSGGGPTTATVAAASYYLSAAGGFSGLLATLAAALTAARAPTDGAWSVVLSTTSGQVTIDCTSGGKLTKTGGVDGVNDAGANVATALAGDGFVEMTAAASSGSTRVVIGLAPSNTSAGRDSGYYFELVEGGQLWVRELGVDIGQVSTWADGDVFRVRRTGTRLTYEKNGVVVYTSLAAVSVNLFGDFSLKNASTRAVGIRLYDGTAAAYVAITWSNVANVTTAATTYSLAWTTATLRDLLGFTADIVSANTPSVGTKQARALWIPECPFYVQTQPRRAPQETDARSSLGPTGGLFTMVGNSYYVHTAASWNEVPLNKVWEASAVLANASWETFVRETQLNLGSTTWFQTSSPVQIYDEAGYLAGGDGNSGAGLSGWQMQGVTGFSNLSRLSGKWAGLWKVTVPQLFSSG